MTPLAFHTSHVSTVVAAHCRSPLAIASGRLACGTFFKVTSRPCFSKMPACLASVSGAKPDHPLMPMVTAVAAMTGADNPAASVKVAAKTAILFMSVPLLFS